MNDANARAETAYDIIDRRCTHSRCAQAESGDAYRMVGRCGNCRAEPLIGLFTAGHDAYGGNCPACGCDRLTWTRLASSDETPAAGVITGQASGNG